MVERSVVRALLTFHSASGFGSSSDEEDEEMEEVEADEAGIAGSGQVGVLPFNDVDMFGQ